MSEAFIGACPNCGEYSETRDGPCSQCGTRPGDPRKAIKEKDAVE